MRLLPVLASLLLVSGAAAQADCYGAAELRAPLLSEIAAGDSIAQSALAGYVCAYAPGAMSTTADLLRALALRDSVAATVGPRVEEWFFAPEGERYDQAEAFYAETEALALRPVSAEGMIFDLAPGPLAEGVLTALAPPDLRLYVELVNAEGASAGGEYPFSDLSAETRMLLAGEALRRDHPASPYVARTQEAYARALLTLASLHPARIEGLDEQWMAGVATAEFYPWASSREALTEAVRRATADSSRYAAPLAAILADPPEAVDGAMEVVALGGGYPLREDAEARVLAHLDAGVDAVGVLEAGGLWRVAFRYYPEGDARLAAAADRAEAAGLAPVTLPFTPETY